ncbi:thiolase family protein [Humidisolicoccus flavus]|uniref:thiolase family protein n=1 Tax=Humidisolicoccus flavus TaxID=3111414 RepID=UPI0032546F2B
MGFRNTVIVDSVRTPSGKGKPGGALSEVHPAALLGQTLHALLERSSVEPGSIDDVIAGCVSQVGEQSANIARNAIMSSGLPVTLPGVTIDRQCGSGQQATLFAAALVETGVASRVIAGGVESMSRVPLGSAQAGQDPFSPASHERFGTLVHQGISAELIAARYGLSRAMQDAFAAQSHQRASAADFTRELTGVLLPDGRRHDVDETIRATTTIEALGTLNPAFRDPAIESRFPEIQWSVTAGSSSPFTDGAAAALVMREDEARDLGLRPLARIVDGLSVGSDPIEMLTGIIPACEQLLERNGLHYDDIDRFEVNEAFASVVLAWIQHSGVDPARVNPEGGAIALGHPLGATGVRIMTTLLHGLHRSNSRFGVQLMCEGAGMANATLFERIVE